MTLADGLRLGRYEILAPIGSGLGEVRSSELRAYWIGSYSISLRDEPHAGGVSMTSVEERAAEEAVRGLEEYEAAMQGVVRLRLENYERIGEFLTDPGTPFSQIGLATKPTFSNVSMWGGTEHYYCTKCSRGRAYRVEDKYDLCEVHAKKYLEISLKGIDKSTKDHLLTAYLHLSQAVALGLKESSVDDALHELRRFGDILKLRFEQRPSVAKRPRRRLSFGDLFSIGSTIFLGLGVFLVENPLLGLLLMAGGVGMFFWFRRPT